ncbi:hypothetical protein Syun_018156 [Stephania yunnanensis]|uniref:Bet v I/Major latex protein domain-containing protein n=1 Tax=Stephania yunnanensis TaxID=152371 RepID=A0AAP0IRS3_9MAGN
MKRKKWSEEEEETLINKYSELQSTGTLAKLKTREKKFQPIADHVNSLHHLIDPSTFPFRWSWRDVSIKVQNMRHQYMGVKQKIRVSDDDFNWADGDDHWPNFFKYKQVFGDVEIDHNKIDGNNTFNDGEGENELELEVGLLSDDCSGGEGEEGKKRGQFGVVGLGREVLELGRVLGRRRERERGREEEEMEREERWRERENEREERWAARERRMECVEMEWEERERVRARREMERRVRVEREFDEGRRRWMMKMEEKREEEEMVWRERMMELQIEHEKQMMQMHADASQSQMQVLGVLARIVCQFFGAGNDGLGGGLGGLPPQVLQNLQHPGSLVGDNGKPDANSDTHFIGLELGQLAYKLLPDVIKMVELVEGDGGVGTVLKVTFPPVPGLGFTNFKEKFTKIDHENRIKESDVIEGGYLTLGFSLYRVIFEIIEKDAESSTIRSVIEYEVGEEFAKNATLVTTKPLEAIAEAIAKYIIDGKRVEANVDH